MAIGHLNRRRHQTAPPESATSVAQILTGSVSAPGAALDTSGETRGRCLIVIDDDDEASLGLYKTLLREPPQLAKRTGVSGGRFDHPPLCQCL